MIKRLSQLLKGVMVEAVNGRDDVAVTAVTSDSRQVTPGTLFVAVRGTQADGHDFICRAVAAGATAIVCENMPVSPEASVTYIKVSDTAVALGQIAAEWYDHPSRELTLIGVTGTNGKTTIATLLYEMARLNGEKAGLLSTVANYIDTERLESTHTTPDVLTINSLLRRMADAGCTFAAMEVSSHACAQKRIAGLHFAGGIFSNLTRDHLDYHKTFDEYLKAKKSFFDTLPNKSWALTNADDRNGEVMLQNTRAMHRTYALHSDADFKCRILENRLDGMLLQFNGREVETLFTGRFNAYNLMAVYAASVLSGYDPEGVLVNMSRLVPVAGRFQPFRSGDGAVTAIVDYAHTPDAIVNVLDTVRDIIGPSRSIITVTGAGGDRDRGKRPIMAREAAMRSEQLVLTSDNPRSEDPEAIIEDMMAGETDEQKARTLVIVDRRQAIRTAVRLARGGDVVVVCGKGHETYEIFRDRTIHFDDREEVCAALETLVSK
ncbi:MAG: UDP-N-acetylmuramoyl-L-alanyl-D-glutamate--2,6-diaminopimelate ligase [Muribaculaceae bacterium]|nr:UDP-N-acetylmuramoyl-L-alanyl-D-glutamate--2,6-diaminopimelate ligase [Muribaculaceae bacterium]